MCDNLYKINHISENWWAFILVTYAVYRVSGLEVYKNTCLYLVPKSFMKFMFSTVYSVTQKDFYARPYTSMWAPDVARQISKRYSTSCHVFSSIIDLRGILVNDSRTRSTVSSVRHMLFRMFSKYLNISRSLLRYLENILNSMWRKRLWIVCVSHSLGADVSQLCW